VEKKLRRTQRLLLDKEIVRLLTAASTQLVRGGYITNTPSIPLDNCSGAQFC
jgi:hypothetical protein